MRPHRPLGSLLRLALLASLAGCESDVITAQEPVDRRQVSAAPSAEFASMSDRELLIAVLGRLGALEARLAPDSGATTATLAASPGVPRLGPPGSGSGGGQTTGKGQGQGGGPLDPNGVPHQLAILRDQVAVLTDKVNTVMIGIGLPKPPDSDMSDTELFETSSKVCFSLGASIDTKLTGGGKMNTEAMGGLGIDFYGNKMLVHLKGLGNIAGEITASPIKAGATYNFCVNAGRAEAQHVIAALPFSPADFRTRFQTLASQVRDVRSAPFSIINPNFRLFGMTEGGYPSPSEMLNRLDDFFGLVKGPICNRLKSRFDIVSQLGLGDGPLAGITSPAVTKLQERFNDDC